MKDFTNPIQILEFLDDINSSACDALANNDFQAFHSAVDELIDTGIYKTETGQAVITYNNMFGASAPYNNFFTNYGFSKIKDNDFFLTNEIFRKTANQIKDLKESCLMLLVQAKQFNNSKEALEDIYSYDGDADAEKVPSKKVMSIDKEAEKALKATQKADKRLIKKLVDAQVKYLSDIDTLLYQTQMEYNVGKTTDDTHNITPYIELDDEFTYEDKVRCFIQPIRQLASERRKYILTYQQDLDEVIPDFDNCHSLSEVLEQVNQYIEAPYIDVNKPFFNFDSISFNDSAKDEKYTLQQYLTTTGNYGKNRLSFWTQGRHQTNEYINWKRETALRTFLYLGIPAKDIDAFFRLYGISFGTSTDVFTVTLENGYKMLLPEVYVRNLIHLGLSYDIINYIIPKRNND